MSIKSLFLKTNILGASSTSEERTLLFRSLYDDYNFYVRKTLYWLVGAELVDDAVQETFINIWKKLDQFQGQSRVKTWIYRVAVNTGISVLRKHKRHQGYKEIDENDALSKDLPEDILMNQMIERAIRSLDEKIRIVFVLFYKQELSLKEISEALKIPQGTVKSRLFKGRDEFKHYLSSNGVSYES